MKDKTSDKLAFELGVKTLRNALLKEVLARHKPLKEGSIGFRDIEEIAKDIKMKP